MLTNELHLLKTVVEESPIAMALYSGPEMTVRLVNKVMLDIWQKDNSVIGKPFSGVISPVFSSQIHHRLTEVYNSGINYEITEHLLELVVDGQLAEFYYNIIFKPLKNATGEVWSILVTAIDVTTQVLVKMEVNVKESQHQSDQKFRDLIEHAPVAIGIFRGLDMVIESANDSLLRLWGKEADVIGLPLLTALPEIKELPFMEILRNVYTSGQPYYGYEMLSKLYKKRFKQDTYFNFVYKPIIEADGKIDQVLVVANEITAQVTARKELEESEKRFKGLILEAPTATALYTGSDMIIEVANEAMLNLWGKNETVIGTPLAKALPELEGQPFIQLLNNVFTTGTTYHSNESKADLVVNGSLQSFYFNFTYKPLLNTEGKVYSILNMAVDVTSQVQARKEQEEIAHKKDEFLSVASHELKTPLTTLKASLQLINKVFKSNPSSPALPVFIHKANSSLSKILHLIDDLMHISKIQQGHLPLNKTWFKFSNLINDCCDHVRAENIYDLVVEGDTELEVYADYARIDQVVVNFVNNAVKYAPDANKIILRIEKLANEAKISVQDFGIGIPVEKQKHLFDRYFRVDYSGIQFSGLGLGLYIAAEIIERHSGKIGVSSVVGKGSTFWFTLPLN